MSATTGKEGVLRRTASAELASSNVRNPPSIDLPLRRNTRKANSGIKAHA
jgi:hypothetical protein